MRPFGEAFPVHRGRHRGVSGVLAFTLELERGGHRRDSDLPITGFEGLFLAPGVLLGGFGRLLCHFGSMELIVFLSPRSTALGGDGMSLECGRNSQEMSSYLYLPGV